MNKWIVAGVLVIAGITGAVVFRHLSGSTNLSTAVEVDWRLLGEMDYVTGKASNELKALDNQLVRVPGFMVPLEDNQKEVSEFLLVPTPQACIHVPPPPPNQMLYSKVNIKGLEPSFGPIWVYGTLRLVSKRHMYGEASFEIDVEKVEPYK